MTGIHTDLADAIVAACNAEEHALDELTFQRLTRRLTLEERHAVFTELPPWAQRQIDVSYRQPIPSA
jgi:negative regulator of sigma E activity